MPSIFATIVELPGGDHQPWAAGGDQLADAIEAFVRDLREDLELDRILATVLATDIVGETDRAARPGDKRWRDPRAEHHRLARGRSLKAERLVSLQVILEIPPLGCGGGDRVVVPTLRH